MTSELDKLSAEFLPAIESEIRSVLLSDRNPADRHLAAPDQFYGMMHYHMGWLDENLQPLFHNSGHNSGKRIRPILCLLSCAVGGGNWQKAIPAAAAIEILHNFSLVHDDIQDASPTRRGRATLWTLWGEAQAINTGDAIFAKAHLALNRLIERETSPAIVVQAFRRFDETCIELTKGQYMDMRFESLGLVSVEDYLSMIAGKTAALVSLCCELGAMTAEASQTIVDHMAQFGQNLGLAFQVHDDILGIWGDESVTGKSAATDIVTRKKTLPVLYALEKSSALKTLYEGQANGQEFVRNAVSLLDETGARHYAEERAKYYSQEALAHLEAINPTGDAGTALFQLSHMLLQRDH
ncbi:MAG: polyprenyl synthetase family protein [Chloroflexota bacterium]|jgi:geranylgeranyl diphosphate synthase, type I